MTILVKSIQSETIAGLIAAVNTFLAALTGGASVTIIGFDAVLADLDRYKGLQFGVLITYDDAAPAAQTDPYVFMLFDEGNSTDLETAMNAWYALRVAGSDFVTGARDVTFANNPSRLPRLDAWAVYCEDATNGPTNWALI
jgi:hypothetical protein